MIRLPRRTLPPLVHVASCVVALSALAIAAAHATIVFGTLRVEPNPPPPSTPLELRLMIDDPTGAPVEDAVVIAQFTPAEGADLDLDAEPLVSTAFRETDPGAYAADIELPTAGPYRVVLRDRTFAQEEAIQIVTMEVGGDTPVEPIDFIFPPTATGAGLGTWLIWLIAIPLVAGIVVTVLVLRGGSGVTPDGKPEAGA